jgi:hypothetical protein
MTMSPVTPGKAILRRLSFELESDFYKCQRLTCN